MSGQVSGNLPPYGLPIVQHETAESVLGDIREQGEGFLADAQDRLREHNPVLGHTIGQFTTLLGIKSDGEVMKVYSLLLMAHELLRKQAEADSLNSTIV